MMPPSGVWVQHGFYCGEPRTPERAAISLAGKCEGSAACASAQLLNNPGEDTKLFGHRPS